MVVILKSVSLSLPASLDQLIWEWAPQHPTKESVCVSSSIWIFGCRWGIWVQSKGAHSVTFSICIDPSLQNMLMCFTVCGFLKSSQHTSQLQVLVNLSASCFSQSIQWFVWERWSKALLQTCQILSIYNNAVISPHVCFCALWIFSR